MGVALLNHAKRDQTKMLILGGIFSHQVIAQFYLSKIGKHPSRRFFGWPRPARRPAPPEPSPAMTAARRESEYHG